MKLELVSRPGLDSGPIGGHEKAAGLMPAADMGRCQRLVDRGGSAAFALRLGLRQFELYPAGFGLANSSPRQHQLTRDQAAFLSHGRRTVFSLES